MCIYYYSPALGVSCCVRAIAHFVDCWWLNCYSYCPSTASCCIHHLRSFKWQLVHLMQGNQVSTHVSAMNSFKSLSCYQYLQCSKCTWDKLNSFNFSELVTNYVLCEEEIAKVSVSLQVEFKISSLMCSLFVVNVTSWNH